MDLEIGIHMGRDPRDRFRGCLLGAAMGDALGMPLQGLNREKIRELHSRVVDYVKPHPDHPLAHLEPGQYTDDTQLMLAQAEALVEGEGYNPHKLRSKLLEWYNQEVHRNPEHTTVAAVARLDAGESYKDSGMEGATGAGALVRCIPIGMVYTGEDLLKFAYKACAVTHKAKRTFVGTLLTAHMVDRLLGEEDVDRAEFLDSMVKFAFRLEEGFKMSTNVFSEALYDLGELFGESFKAGILSIGNSHYVVETVCAALFAFLYSPGDPEATLTNAVNHGGAADTIGAVAGALSGAYNGISRFPPRWLDQLEDNRRIMAAADSLFAMRQK